jgi:hypothetical protein
MKFPMPELILGALLAVAIFAMGMVFAPSQKYFDRAREVAAFERGEPPRKRDSESDLIVWLTKDAAGFFTAVLGAVGALQAILFFVQLRLMRRSLAPAEAAAKTAQAAAEHIPIVERAYIFIEARPVQIGPEGEAFHLELTLRNLGQTPGFPKRIFGKFYIEEPAEEPVFGNEFLIWDIADIVSPRMPNGICLCRK